MYVFLSYFPVAHVLGTRFEPYVMGLFPSMLMAMGYKAAPVRDAAYGASAATLQSINPRCVRTPPFQISETPSDRRGLGG